MSVLGSARLLTEEGRPNDEAASSMDVEDDTEWVTDVYSQLNGTPMRNISTRWQRLNGYRVASGIISLVLVGLGVALAVPRSSCVSSLLPSKGVNCDAVAALSMTVAALLCATGLFGCVASYRSAQASMSCCLALLFFVYAGLCGCCLAYVVYSRVQQLENLGTAWQQLVAMQAPFVCSIQRTLQCSGFAPGQCCHGQMIDSSSAADELGPLAVEAPPCFLERPNGTTYDVGTHAEVTWPQTMCLASCADDNAQSSQSCAAPLKAAVRKYFVHSVGILAAVTLLFSLMGSITAIGVYWKPYIDSRMQHRF